MLAAVYSLKEYQSSHDPQALGMAEEIAKYSMTLSDGANVDMSTTEINRITATMSEPRGAKSLLTCVEMGAQEFEILPAGRKADVTETIRENMAKLRKGS